MTRRDGVAFVLGALTMAALLLMTSCATTKVLPTGIDAPLSGWDQEGTEGCTRGWLGIGRDAEGVLIVPVIRCPATQGV